MGKSGKIVLDFMVFWDYDVEKQCSNRGKCAKRVFKGNTRD